MGCDLMDTECIGSKLLSCAIEEELVSEKLTSEAVTDGSVDQQRTTEELSRDGEGEISKVTKPLQEDAQIRLLSFSACLMQSFVAGIVERKQSALLAAKKVRRLINTL